MTLADLTRTLATVSCLVVLLFVVGEIAYRIVRVIDKRDRGEP